MGITTQSSRALEHARGSRRSARLAAGITLAGLFSLVSAPAMAGLREITPGRQAPAAVAAELSAEDSSIPNQNWSDATRPATEVNALAIGARSGTALLTPSRDTSITRLPVPDMARIANATPADDTKPLLIPLPNAVSMGLSGLAIVAVVAATKRIRRRIFA